MDLNLLIDYDFIGDKFWIGGNVKDEKIKYILEEFLRSQLGAGKDDQPPNIVNLYTINISVDLSCDKFSVSHNCGNKSLREGILLRLLERL